MRSIDRRSRRLDDPHLEARLVRMPRVEMHFHFEDAFRWSTIRELHPRGKELPEREPWLAQERMMVSCNVCCIKQCKRPRITVKAA